MEDLILRRNPTRKHPLLGLTVLVVEDSKFASDALRLLCLRSGARIRRADCLCSARKHLTIYRPSLVIIDLGLPDGSGLELIQDLNEARPRVNVLLAMSGDGARQAEAMTAGADGFLEKPLANLTHFQTAILSYQESAKQITGLHEVGSHTIKPDQIAYRDDLSHAATLLEGQQDDSSLKYVAQFLRSIATSAGDIKLEKAAMYLSRSTSQGYVPKSAVREVLGMLQRRMDRQAAF